VIQKRLRRSSTGTSSAVYALVARLTGDSLAAEELAHETFVRAYRGLGRFRGDARFSTWITQIAVHLVRDRIRERQRSKTVSLDALLERDSDSLCSLKRAHATIPSPS